MRLLNEDGKPVTVADVCQLSVEERRAMAEALAEPVGNLTRARLVLESKLLPMSFCGHIGKKGVCKRDKQDDTAGCSRHPAGRPYQITEEEREGLTAVREGDEYGRKVMSHEELRLKQVKAKFTRAGKCANNDRGRGCSRKPIIGSDFCLDHGGNHIILDEAAMIDQQRDNKAAAMLVEEPVKGTKSKLHRLVESYLTDPDLLNTRKQAAQAKATLDVVMDEFSRVVECGEFSKELVQLTMGAIDNATKQIERLENIESKKVLTAAHILRLNNDLKTLVSAAPEGFRPFILNWVDSTMFGEMKALPEAQVAYVVPSYLEGEVVE